MGYRVGKLVVIPQWTGVFIAELIDSLRLGDVGDQQIAVCPIQRDLRSGRHAAEGHPFRRALDFRQHFCAAWIEHVNSVLWRRSRRTSVSDDQLAMLAHLYVAVATFLDQALGDVAVDRGTVGLVGLDPGRVIFGRPAASARHRDIEVIRFGVDRHAHRTPYAEQQPSPVHRRVWDVARRRGWRIAAGHVARQVAEKPDHPDCPGRVHRHSICLFVEIGACLEARDRLRLTSRRVDHDPPLYLTFQTLGHVEVPTESTLSPVGRSRPLQEGRSARSSAALAGVALSAKAVMQTLQRATICPPTYAFLATAPL